MRHFFPFILCGAFMAVPAITGCDRTVSTETKTTRDSDGDVSQTERTVEKNADGTTSETVTKKEVDK